MLQNSLLNTLSGCDDRIPLRRFISAAVMVMMLVGCVTGLGGRADVNTESQATEARIKVALAKELNLNAAPLNIRVVKGAATIDGFVETEAQRTRVQAIAAAVDGVTSVRIDIEVK